MRVSVRINGHSLIKLSMLLLVIILCFPLSMVLPSMIRMSLQVMAALIFVISLLFLRRYAHLVALVLLFGCSILYYIGSWEEMMKGTTFLFNSLCCWIFAIYGILCLEGKVTFERSIFLLLVLLTLITAITTIAGLVQYPLAVRELGRDTSYAGTDIKSVYRLKNIASWSQVYGMVFIQGGIAHFYKETKNKIVLVTIVLVEICIILSQLTFGIIVSIAILTLTLTNAKSKKNILAVVAILSISGIAILNAERILLWAVNSSSKHGFSMLTTKLRDFYNLLIMKTTTGDATERFELYSKSLSSFTQYPLGLFWHREVQAVNYIGYHSEMFDFLGTMGIFGVVLLAIWIIVWISKMRKVEKSYCFRFLLYMFLSFVAIWILNPVFYSPQIWIGALSLPAMVVRMGDRESRVNYEI